MKLATITAGALVSALLFSVSASAQWSGEGDLAYSNANGNTNNSALASKLALGKTSGDWSHSVEVEAVGAAQNDQTTAERYTLGAQSDRAISEDAFLFAGARYLSDRFSGYASQASAKLGYGYKIINSESSQLSAEIGAGYRSSELQNNGGDENEGIVSLAVQYAKSLTDTTDLDASYFTESGSSNRYSKAVVGIRVAISDNLGLRAAYQVEQNSNAPAAARETDSLSTIGITYRF